MAHRLLYLMITVIALQFSWSAVAAYCMHEAPQDHQYVGHRQHSLLADDLADNASKQQGQPKKSAHHHHSVCSHGTLALIGIAESVFHPLSVNVAPVEDVSHPSSTYTLPPERPQWNASV